MTLLAAVAAGSESADSLEDLCRGDVESGGISLVRHNDLAVAWQSDSRWIDTYDDDAILVVLDGRLHGSSAAVGLQAQMLHERYRAMGRDVAKGMLGDFVLIVLDRSSASLLVARDAVGVRPWYQAATGALYAGASDVATLVSLPWVDTSVNEAFAIEYLAARPESRGETFYQGIRTLRPGLTWHHADGRVRTFPHHRWDLEPELGISWDAAAERCRVLLDTAVRSRLEVSAAATCELSGGIDSSSVVGTIVQSGRDDLVVGRVVFDTPRADESRYSDAVVDHWGLTILSARPWLPTEEENWDLTLALRRPPPDPHFTMFAGLHRMFGGAGRPDGLTGLGGDDAFVAAGVASRVVGAVSLRQGQVLKSLLRTTARRPRFAWSEFLRPTLHYLAPWKGARSPHWLSDRAIVQADLPRLFRGRPESVTGVAAIDERIANLTSGYDAGILEMRALVTDDVGRRETHPFLDARFIEGTYGLDPWWPTRGGHTRALQVDAYRDRLPPAVSERRSKAEFSEIFWPQLLNQSWLSSVTSGPLADLGWIDISGFDELTSHAKSGMANAAIPLWRCVTLDRWLRSL